MKMCCKNTVYNDNSISDGSLLGTESSHFILKPETRKKTYNSNWKDFRLWNSKIVIRKN